VKRNPKKKESQGIDRFIGLSWKKAKRELEANAHLLVLTDTPDERAIEVAQTYRDHGMDAGMAALVAHLYVKEHGGAAGAVMAIKLYDEVCQSFLLPPTKGRLRKRAERLKHELRNLEYMVYFARPSIWSADKWPLEHQFKARHERSGLANVLMFVSAKDLGDSSTSNMVASGAIMKFLKEGLKEK
jgi:hypothetical protein